MRINAINNVMRPVRNMVAATVVAATPIAVKAESAVTPKQFATTNTVNMSSFLQRGEYFGPDDLSMPAQYYGLENGKIIGDIAAKTNEMARYCVVNEFTPKSAGGFRIGGVADGHVATARLLGSEKLGENAEWRVIDFLENRPNKNGYYDGNSATIWFVDLDNTDLANKFKFYKWEINPDIDLSKDVGTVIKKLDVDGNPIP